MFGSLPLLGVKWRYGFDSDRLQHERLDRMFTTRDSTDRRYLQALFTGLLLCVCFLGLSLPCRGDLLTLQNDETLSGTLLRIRNSTLVFRTSLEGQMMLPVDRAKKLTTQNIFSIQLQDGGMLIGRFGQKEGAQVLFPPDPTASLSLSLEKVVEALPVPTTSPAREEEPALPRLQSERALRLQAPGLEDPAEGLKSEEKTESLRDSLALRPEGEYHPLRSSLFLPSPLLLRDTEKETPLMLQSELKPRIWVSDEDQALSWLENLFKKTETLPVFSMKESSEQLRLQRGPDTFGGN